MGLNYKKKNIYKKYEMEFILKRQGNLNKKINNFSDNNNDKTLQSHKTKY